MHKDVHFIRKVATRAKRLTRRPGWPFPRSRRGAPEKTTLSFMKGRIDAVNDAEIAATEAEIRHGQNGQSLQDGAPANYSEMLFLQYLASTTAEGAYTAHANELLLRAIRCAPGPTNLMRLLLRIYKRQYLMQNAAAINAFRTSTKGCKLIIMHLSCLPRIHHAQASCETFQAGTALANITLVGDPHTNEYRFNEAERLLSVPAEDNYESLSKKISLAYLFLGMADIDACIAKVDDDIHCVSPERLLGTACRAVMQHNYVGRVLDPNLGTCRVWHFGKCSAPSLNIEPYSLIVNNTYAAGPCYLLSPTAVQILAKAAVYLPAAYEVHHAFEDIAVGQILNSFGVRPYEYDLVEHGEVTEVSLARRG